MRQNWSQKNVTNIVRCLNYDCNICEISESVMIRDHPKSTSAASEQISHGPVNGNPSQYGSRPCSPVVYLRFAPISDCLYQKQFGRFGLKFNILRNKGKLRVKIMGIGQISVFILYSPSGPHSINEKDSYS
jgi:hypothetical protein